MSPTASLPSPAPASRLDQVPAYVFARFDQLIAEQRAAGHRPLSLAMGDPDQATFAPVVDAGIAALSDPRQHRYPSNRGLPEFRAAVAEFYRRRFSVTLDPGREVLPTLGSKECLANVCLAFLDPGSVAIIPDPGYPPYSVDARLAGAEAVRLTLRADRGFAPDFAALSPADLERARLLFLNYPNNPTGAVATEEMFGEAVALARRWGLLLVSDNAYSEVAYDGHHAPSLLATPGADEVAVEVFSFSKAYNMAGWRVGALVGAPAVLDAYWRLKSHLDQGPFNVVQLAAARALQPDIDPLVAERNQIYRHRRDRVISSLQRQGCPVSAPLATLYVWAPIPDGFTTSTSFCETVLDRAGVLLAPGSAYGPAGERWFRVSLGAPDEQLEQALDQLTGLDLSWHDHKEAA